MKRMLFAILMLAGTGATLAAMDVACFQDCVREGYGRSQCVTTCESHDNSLQLGGSGILGQPGVPRNPALDQMQQQSQPPRRALPPVSDAKCVADCRAKGYNYQLCRQQCSYTH